ncbi:MAG: tetratricopeptide repeat protein [Rickettsiales bacterium]
MIFVSCLKKRGNLIGLILACGVIACNFPKDAYATKVDNAENEDTRRTSPLEIYIPKIAVIPDYFVAKNIKYLPDKKVVQAKGNVEIEYGDLMLRTEHLEYNQIDGSVKTYGEVAVLDKSGKVTFHDSLELDFRMKRAVVNSFRRQFADNLTFTKNDASGKNGSSSRDYVDYKDGKTANGDGFFGRVFSYLGFSNNSKAEELSSLTPAAGGDKIVIGSVPLIDIIDDEKINKEIGDVDNAGEDISKKGEVKEEKLVENISSEDNKEIIGEDFRQEFIEKNLADALRKATYGGDKIIKSESGIKNIKKEPDNIKADNIKKENLVKDDGDTKKTAPKKLEAKFNSKKVERKSERSIAKPTVKNLPKDSGKVAKVKKDPFVRSNSGRAVASNEKIIRRSLKSISKKNSNQDNQKIKIRHTRQMNDLFNADDFVGEQVMRGNIGGVKVEVKRPSLNVDYELEKAYNAINSGKNEVAIDIYKNILKDNPSNQPALFGLATLYHRARMFDSARSLYSRLLAINPRHRDGFNNFLVLLSDKAPNETLLELEKLESKNPSFSMIPAQIAFIYQKLGDSDKAIDKMLKAVSLSPENVVYRYNLAIMLDKKKEYKKAAGLYRQLIEDAARGEKIPGNIDNIQQRLTFISSNNL